MIRIWKFKDAPQSLKELYSLTAEPAWVLEVPSEMASEIQDVMRTASLPARELSRQVLPGRMIIFYGQVVTQLQRDAS